MADVRKAAIVKDAILWGSSCCRCCFCHKSRFRFWRLLAPGSGAYPQARLSEARWSRLPLAPGASWLLLAPPSIPPSDPPSGSNVAASLLLSGHFFFKPLLSVEISRRQGSRRVNYPPLQSGETLGWSIVRATPTLRTKLTSAGACKVRKKFGNVHKKIKTDS